MKKTVNLLKFVLVLSVLLTGITSHAINRYKPKIGNSILLATSPTSISGPSSICAGSSATLTAIGATLNSGEVYQWGTGTTIGSNVISGQTGVTIQVTPNVTTSYWVRVINSTTLVATAGVIKSITVNAPATPSIAPTSITGTTTICNGSSTTLTAVGGVSIVGSVYQWGTGTTIGSNIITGQTTTSITVNPTTSTTYWVRKIDPLPCNAITNGITQNVIVNPISTAPTSITGTTTLCLGSSTTLTATGGSLATGSVYEWGTGLLVGSNTLIGQTASTLTITPSTTTSYWVRRTDTSPCANITSGLTTTVSVSIPNGDQTSYTTDSWIGYVYAPLSTVPPISAFSTNYRGYVTQPEIFDQDLSTSSIFGPNLCGSYSDQFAIRFKMFKNFTAGYYTFTVGGDDGYRLSLDGGTTFLISNWTDHGYTSSTSTTIYLSGNTNLVLEYYENGGYSRVSFNYTSCTNFSTAPTSITGLTALCYGAGGTSLTAIGGFENPSTVYQWGTGNTIGSNIIAGATTASYYINPSVTTTYWVRRVDPAPCNQTTSGVTLTVNLSTASTIPTTISGTTTICSGNSTTLTASGGIMGTGAVYQWGTGYSAGMNIITGATGNNITVSPTSMTGYWVRRIDPAPCNTNTGQITTTVNVNPVSTAPTSITGAGATTCAGNSTTLTATGGISASGSTYQWGTGSTVGSNIISGQTGVSITVNPMITTTYWVRRYDSSCTYYTSGVSITVLINSPSGNPTIPGTNAWNVYGYSNGDITLSSAIYAGYYTTTSLNFDTQTGTNSWSNTLSPSIASGWVGCPVPNDNFTLTAKRKGFPCGTYTLAMQNWDDVAQVYLNGTLIWSGTCCGWSGTNLVIGSYNLDSTSDIEIRLLEYGGLANIGVSFTNTNLASTAPTSISGINSICNGSSTTLTANGGSTGTTGSFQWGTGSTIGSNIIAGQTTASITVNPSTDTIYWVRRVDIVCGNATSGISQLINVSPTTFPGTLSCVATTICKSTTPSPIVLSRNVGNVIKWQYATDLAFTVGVTDIVSTATTLTSSQIGSLSTTRYFRAVVQSGSCTTAYTTPITINVPAAVTYNGSWVGSPSATTPVIISGNLTLSSSLNVCSCQVTGSAIITVPANLSLIVQKDIMVASTANIIIEDKGSLVQVDDAATNVGNITFKRKSTPLKQYDYTYWSSPLAAQTLGQLATSSLFYSFNPNVNNWTNELATSTMTVAKGYIARAPNNLNFSTPQTTSVTFTGVPNSGVINAPIVKTTGLTYNLIGNPYPSAIDIDLFLLDPANSSVVNGTIYLWTHNTAISNSIPGNAVYNYTRDDYAKYNITGGVKTASSALSGGVTPSGKVASGQGFFIEANAALANGNYQAKFSNSMRVAGSNDQFFKVSSIASNSSQNQINNAVQREKHRVWVSVSNNDGAYDETLIGYITGATNGLDNLFDGKTLLGSNVVSLYSISDSNTLAIQGRALPFSDSDFIPLGFTTTITGTFKIGLENFDGLFANQNIYLLDKTTNIYHDLKAQDFSFNIPVSGTFDNRFELHFSSIPNLANSDFDYSNSVQIIRKDQHIAVKAGGETINSVQVFDLLGKLVYSKNKIESSEFNTSDLNISSQVLLVRVTLENDGVITKKVLMN